MRRTGGNITSDAGLLLIKEFDSKLKLSKRIADRTKDKRDNRKTTIVWRNQLSS